MKKLSADSQHTKLIAAASAFVWTIAIVTSAGAAQLQEARVTQVVNDVKLLLEQAAPRPAALSDLIRRGTAVRTGTQSRSELTFADLTITRLGANTIFSFKEGTREMNLVDGAILFQVPKGSGGATIRTVGVTATITGTTGIGEFHPATTSHPLVSKWLCLEGKIVLHLPNGQSVELGPGQMVTTDGKSFSQVSDFDIAKLVSTSLFFIGFDRPLPSLDLIMLAAQNQLTSGLLATNPLDPIRLVDVISQVTVAEQTEVSPPPPPPPSKFGTPSVISSPDPYLITSSTVIKTDPSITTNGRTDYGKIYRGQTDDGAFSLWAFGSTSAVDTALRIDDIFFGDPSHLPIAVFKFQSLSLTGDPIIDTSNNGVTKLGLIGVDGITSGPPGGTLTFTGLDLLVLGTVNGSINLTSDVSFQDLHELVMYARGAGSDLTINSPISNIGILGLVAEDSIHLTNPGTMRVGKLDAIAGGDMMLQIGGSLLLNGRVRLDAIVLPGASVASGANLTLNVTGDYTNNSATESSRLTITNRDHIGTGGNIGVDIGGDLTAMNDFNLVVQNTNRQIDNGGNITLEVGGSINVAGALDATLDNTGGLIGNDTSITITSSGAVTAQGDANFQILNNDGGQIGGNANISVTTGGDITANSILGFVNNHNGGAITSGANISFNIGGALNTQGDATFVISNLNEGPGGGTIGSVASLDINAASISVGGFFQTFVGANAGGSITGNASNTVNLTGDLVVQGPILADIQDTGFNQINPINFIAGGHIGGNATITLSAQNITTFSTASGIPGIDTMALEASIYSNGSGTIGGDAIVNVSASQDISAPGTVFFTVANGNYMGFGGGTIGGDAKLNISAVNFMAGILFAEIFNYGASIGGNANINFNLTGDLTAPGDAIFHIFNYGGGSIVGNAAINVDAANITANSLRAEIDNSNGGMIGGSANVNFNLTGDLTTIGDATFSILNNAGTIGGDTEINVNAANITANSLLAQIDNSNGGSIGTGGNIFVTTGQLLSANSVNALIDNSGGGQIGTGGNLSVTTGGNLVTTGDASFIVQNTSGMINNGGNLNLTLNGNVQVNSLSTYVQNYDETANPAGHIGTGGNIDVEIGGNLTVTSFVDVFLNNRGGGMIDSGGNLTFNVGGALNVGPGPASGSRLVEFVVSNRYDDSAGNTTPPVIGSDVSLLMHAGSINITLPAEPDIFLTTYISNRGGTINGNASVNFNVSQDVSVLCDADIDILNDGGPNIATPFAGTIHGNATLEASAANFSANSLIVDLNNKNGGVIDSNATLSFNLSGNLTTQGEAFFEIANQQSAFSNGAPGGSIGLAATLDINAANISTGTDFRALILNHRAGGAPGPGAGSIGTDATLNISVGSFNVGSFDASISNNNNITANGTGGSIGGNAAINANITNTLSSGGNATFQISNQSNVAGSPGGSIGGDATINVSAANITANSLLAEINNSNGGMIGGAVNVAVNIGNNVTVTGSNGISLNILNSSSHIVTGANVLYSVGGTTSTTGLTEYIDNTNGGVIDNGGNITLNTVGPVMLDGGLDLEMDNFNGGTINNGANVTAHFVGDVTATVGQFHSLNWNVLNGSGFFNPTATGGTIGTGGDINVTFDGDASTTGTSTTGSISAQIQNGNGGSIGTGGNISVTVGGDLTAGPLFFMTENQGGHIGTGGNMTLQVAGDITTQGDANFQIFNNDNGSGAGTIDLSATINVTAANISSGGSLFDNIFNYSGGSIGENARINLAVGGNLTTAQGGTLDLSILNNDGGHIGGDASILASINGNVNTTDLNIGIQDYNGGVIMGGGNVVLNVGGSLTVAENTHPLFLFINTFNGGSINNGGNILASVGGDLSTGTISSGIQNQDGGTINTGGNFSLTVGGNLTTAQNTDAAFFINNFNGGFIGNGGSISVSIGGNISAGRALGFTISNETNGIISSDAMMNVAGNNISVVDSLNTFLVNHQGSIGGNAAINFLAPAGIDAGNGAFFAIVNEDNGGTTVGGTIGGDALVHVTADHLSTEALAPSDFNLFGTIHNRGGTIGGNCDVMFDIAGAITTEGRANFDILNFDDGGVNGGGIIGGNAVVSVSANSLTTTTTQSDAGLSISNGSLGSIDGSAIISLNLAGDLTAQGNANFAIGNQDQGSGGGTIGSDATIDVAAASISNQGNLFLTIFNQLGSIGGDAAIRLSLSGDIVSQHDANFWIWNFGVGPPAGTINGDALINVAAVNLTAANGGILTGQILNQNVGLIGGNATMDFDFSGDINAGGVDLIIDNIGGMIGQDARISVTATNISVGGNLDVTIDNSADGGTIGGSANLTFNLTGNLAAQGEANFQILNNDAGQIGGNGNISVTTGGDLTANSIFAFINNRNGGAIGSAANMSFNIGGALSTTGDALFVISNRNDGSGGGTIGSSVNLTLSAASVSGGGNLLTDVSTNQGGHIMGSVHNTVDAAGLLSGGTLDFEIENAGFDTGGGFEPGGTIDADAILSVTASDISTTSDYFNEIIANDGGGHIGGNATVSVVASSMDVATNAFFNILNGQNGAGTPTGSIGGNAAIDVAAATLSIGGNLDSGIDNSGGSISGMAQIIFNLAGNLTTQGDALFVIDNSFDGEVTSGTIGSDATINISANNISTGGSLSAFINNSINPGDGFIGGTIGGDATIDVTANNITANSLLAQIDNTGGSIGASTEGGATINMNVSGTANVTNDATVAIYGSDGAVGGAAININGGSYNVGGTFLSYIDGNGTIAFNNINAHADVLKAGVFGTDGVLNVGGGILEANTTLKLYASGSNGVLNFLNSVTLRGSALTKILAANTINIFDNVRVTIGGSTPADVYTNHANYTGFGGNGTRTGTFAGAGAHDPQPLASAPPFGPASPVKLTTGGNIPSATAVPPQSAPGRTPAPGGNITTRTRIPPTLPSNVLTNGKIADVRRASNVIHVSNSDELLSLLDGAAPGPGGKITIPPAKSASNARNSNRTNVPGRVNTGSRVNVDRRAMDMRTASSSVIRHSPQ